MRASAPVASDAGANATVTAFDPGVTAAETDAFFDVFLSYSSIDSVEAHRVQRFLERYRHPRGMFGSSKLRIKVFRDKTDEDLAPDFLAAFKRRIETTPSFLLLGSVNSFNSQPVQEECRYFVELRRNPINLALLDGSPQKSFPPIVLEQFPNAIHADLCSLRSRSPIRWWLRDHGKFREEMLRIVTSILRVKSGLPLTYDQLRGREKRRQALRMRLLAIATVGLLGGLIAYYFTTEWPTLH